MQQGFTLIDVVVGIGILGVAVVGTTQLMTRAQPLADVSRQTFIALQSAREGVELVQAIRDTNWFEAGSQAWVEGICGQRPTRSFTIDAKSVREGSGLGLPNEPRLFIVSRNGAQEWVHNPVTQRAQETLYNRIITVDCSQKDDEPGIITVTSDVTWEDRGNERHATVTEQLYNWGGN